MRISFQDLCALCAVILFVSAVVIWASFISVEVQLWRLGQ